MGKPMLGTPDPSQERGGHWGGSERDENCRKRDVAMEHRFRAGSENEGEQAWHRGQERQNAKGPS